ncbi:hypothetical protein [Candidatus Electronema sp. JM]|uniref:hypothetical protein n=1 Tax=Candidatus Electronema sp. JM TaxID=3401571 RepID=UPI003AA8515B
MITYFLVKFLVIAMLGGLTEQLRNMRKMLPEEGNIIVKPSGCKQQLALLYEQRIAAENPKTPHLRHHQPPGFLSFCIQLIR